MPEETAIQVNFGKPIPLFPLDTVTLLPQQVLALHIFEPRYRQMVQRALDAAGQIAMAVFRGDAWKQQYHGRPPLRPAVCVGQIVQHERLDDDHFNLLLQGVCRARILEESAPAEGRLYRQALLEPVGIEVEGTGPDLAGGGELLEEKLSSGPLTQLTAAEPLLEYLRNDEVPTHALLELISFTLINDNALRYRLLEEEDAQERARVITGELNHLERLLKAAAGQRGEEGAQGVQLELRLIG